MASFLLLACLILLANLAGLHSASCPKTPIMSSFDAKRYAGRWYEIERFPIIYEAGLDCVTADYGFVNATSVTVKNQGVYLNSNNQATSVNGFAYVPNLNEPNRLLVEFPEVSRLIRVKGNYDVWSTDYSSYSLVYSCKSIFGLFRLESAWILARQKQLDSATVQRLKDVLRAKGVNVNKFSQTKQVCDN